MADPTNPGAPDPARFLRFVRETAEGHQTEHCGPMEYGDGDPMAADAAALLAQLEAAQREREQLVHALRDILNRNHTFFGDEASTNPTSLYNAVQRGRDLLDAMAEKQEGKPA